MEFSWPTIIFAIVGIGLLAYSLSPYLLPRRTDPNDRNAVARLAAEIYADQRILYQPDHDLRSVDLSTFRHLNRAFYDQTLEELEDYGFRYIADIENETLTRVYPNQRTVVRTFLHENGTVVATCFHSRVTGWKNVTAWFTGTAVDFKVVEFGTEFDDNTFVETTNAPESHLLPSEGIELTALDPSLSIEKILDWHHASEDRYLATHGQVRPIRLTSYDDIVSSLHREQALKSADRQRIGYLTEDEFVRISGPNNEELGRAVFAEIQKLHREAEGSA